MEKVIAGLDFGFEVLEYPSKAARMALGSTCDEQVALQSERSATRSLGSETSHGTTEAEDLPLKG